MAIRVECPSKLNWTSSPLSFIGVLCVHCKYNTVLFFIKHPSITSLIVIFQCKLCFIFVWLFSSASSKPLKVHKSQGHGNPTLLCFASMCFPRASLQAVWNWQSAQLNLTPLCFVALCPFSRAFCFVENEHPGEAHLNRETFAEWFIPMCLLKFAVLENVLVQRLHLIVPSFPPTSRVGFAPSITIFPSCSLSDIFWSTFSSKGVSSKRLATSSFLFWFSTWMSMSIPRISATSRTWNNINRDLLCLSAIQM